jgi:hypothetical protein
MNKKTRAFGPFTNVPVDAIKPAGFSCKYCKQPVEKFSQAVPYLVPRMIFHACKCGTLFTWEDESQPDSSRVWKFNVRLMRRSGAQLVVFNGNRPLRPDFSGAN